MTKVDRLVCTDADVMLRSLRGWVSERKLCLFACACLRRIGKLLPDDRCRRAVEVIERCADRLASGAEQDAALADAEAAEAASIGPAQAAARAVASAWVHGGTRAVGGGTSLTRPDRRAATPAGPAPRPDRQPVPPRPRRAGLVGAERREGGADRPHDLRRTLLRRPA